MLQACRHARSSFEVRVTQDGTRDTSVGGSAFRADESSGWVWESARELEIALREVNESHDWESMRILELGAGTGWLSLRMAQLGATVVATDREGALPRLMRNVCRNQERFRTQEGEAAGVETLQVECCALDWEASMNTRGMHSVAPVEPLGPWDWVVGSDLIYMHEMHAPLLNTLSTQIGAACCLLSWTSRKPSEEASFIALAKAEGFTCDLVRSTASPNGAHMPVYCLRRADPVRQHMDQP